MSASRVILSAHAARQLARRGIPTALAERVADTPEQVLALRTGREVRQSIVTMPPSGRRYLIRVIADRVGRDIRIVTVYRTSKVAKYWRGP